MVEQVAVEGPVAFGVHDDVNLLHRGGLDVYHVLARVEGAAGTAGTAAPSSPSWRHYSLHVIA